MRLIVDANILVAELLRARGRELIADSRLELQGRQTKAWHLSRTPNACRRKLKRGGEFPKILMIGIR